MLDTGSSGNVSRVTELPDKPITDPIVPPCDGGCNGLEELVVSDPWPAASGDDFFGLLSGVHPGCFCEECGND